MDCDFQVGAWLVQPMLNSISANGRTIHVEPKVMEVLVYLARHAGEVVPKEQLIRSVWPDTFVTDDVLTRSISELRKAFEDDPKGPRFIQTIAKRGYRLIAPVNWSDQHLGLDEAVSPARTAKESLSETGRAAEGGTGGRRAQLRGVLLRRRAVASGLAGLAFMASYVVWHRLGRHAKPPPAGKIMLVVLPFENLSGDPDQEYFSDGVTEETTTQLARLRPERLGVIGRASAMTYKHAQKTIEEIGKELQVQFVLEGSVRRAGEQVRISAQLVEVGDQTHVWAQSYDRDLRDVLALQDEVARAVVRELGLNLPVVRQAPTASPKPVMPQAYEAYLRGRYFWNRRTPASIRKSIDYFRQALRKDPNFALAYAGLADSLLFDDRPETTAEAKSDARKAIDLDPTLGEPHASLAFIALMRDWDWAEAEREFRRAIELNPNYPTAHHWFAFYYEKMGRLQEAIREVNRALEIDPLSLIIRSALADGLSETGQHDKALEEVRRVLEMDPGFGKGHYTRAVIYERKGMFPEAIEELKMSRKLGINGDEVLSRLAYVRALAGDRVEAERRIHELERRARLSNEPPPADDIAMIYVALGDRDRAFTWLEKAREQRSEVVLNLKADPAFEPLRSDPRYKALLRRMGLPSD